MSEKDYNAVMEELKKILGNVSFAEFNSTFNSIFFDIDNYLNELEKNIDAEIKDSKFLENLSNLRKIDANLIEELKKISATSPTFKEQIEELVNQLKDIDSQKVLQDLNDLKAKIDKSITDFTVKQNEALKKLEPLIKEIAVLVANQTGISQMPILNATLFNLIDNLSKTNFTSEFEKIKEEIEKAQIELAKKMGNLTTDNKNLEKLQEYTKVLKEYVSDVKEAEKPDVKGAINELSEILKYYKPTDENISQLKEKLKKLSEEFKKQLEIIIANADDKFKELLFYNELKSAFTNLAGALKQMAESNSVKPEDFANELKELSSKILGLKKESLEKIFNEYSNFEDVKSYAEKIKEFFEGLKNLINKDKESKTLEQIAKDCEEYIKNFDLGELNPKEDLKEFSKTLVERIKETEIVKQYEDYKDKYQDYKDLIKDMNLYIKNYTINETVDKVRDFVKSISLEELKNKCADLIEELKNKIKDNEKAEKVKEKLEALLKCKTLSEFESALNDLKNTVLEIAKEQGENSKLKSLVEKLKEFEEKHKKEFENSETYKNIKEYSKTIDDFKVKIDEIVKNMGTHTYGKLKEGIEKGFDKFKGDLIEFSDSIEDKLQFEDFKAIKDKVKEIMASKTVGELIDHNKELKQILKDIVSKYAGETKLKKNVDKIKEFNQKVHDKVLEFTPIKQIKEVSSSLKDIIDSIKDNARSIQIQTLNSTITEIKTKLSELPPKIEAKLNNAVDNLPKMVDSLEKVQEKLAALNQTKLNMCIKREINKLQTKSLENKLRILEESELLCKYDEMPTEAMTLSASSSDLNILNNETYSLSVSSGFSLSVESYKSKPCNEDHIQNMKKQISFKSKGTITKQTTKKRITFKMKVTIKQTYKVTKFFYVKMKIKVRYKTASLLRQLEDVESDTFCIPADNEDLTGEEADLDCFTMSDNPDNAEDIGDFTSDSIDIPENATTLSSLDNNNAGNNPSDNTNLPNTDNSNNRNNTDGNSSSGNGNDVKNSTDSTIPYRAFYRSKSSGLSTGAIVGIILGCIAAFIIIVVLIFLLKKQSAPKDINESKTDSKFNLKV